MFRTWWQLTNFKPRILFDAGKFFMLVFVTKTNPRFWPWLWWKCLYGRHVQLMLFCAFSSRSSHFRRRALNSPSTTWRSWAMWRRRTTQTTSRRWSKSVARSKVGVTVGERHCDATTAAAPRTSTSSSPRSSPKPATTGSMSEVSLECYKKDRSVTLELQWARAQLWSLIKASL